MKKVLLLILLLITIPALAQPELVKLASEETCLCLEKKGTVTVDDLQKCLVLSLTKYHNLAKESFAQQNDTSEGAWRRFGKKTGENIQAALPLTCTVFVNLIEKIRGATLTGFNTDSLSEDLARLNNFPEKERNANYYSERGALHLKLADLDKAFADYNQVLQLKPNSIQPLFFKGWILEMKKEYDEAIIIYNELSTKTGDIQYKIFAAVAKRKKESN